MNKFPDKDDIINLTNDEINELNTLIENTIFVELKKVCKKYDLKCTGLKVKETRDYLKTFIEKQNQGKFEYTTEALKKKLLKELKKIMEDNNIKIGKNDKKEDCIKKIVRHFKSSKSRSKSPSPKWGLKFKVPKTKERVLVKNKFKKGDKVLITDLGEYGEIINYDSDNKLYNVLTDTEIPLELSEEEMKYLSPRISPPRLHTEYSAETVKEPSPRISPPRLHTEYSAETVKEPSPIGFLPEIEHEPVRYIEEQEPTIDEYQQPFKTTEIIEDSEHINIEDIEGVLSELQTISVDDILDNNVRIKKSIQKCLALGLM